MEVEAPEAAPVEFPRSSHEPLIASPHWNGDLVPADELLANRFSRAQRKGTS